MVILQAHYVEFLLLENIQDMEVKSLHKHIVPCWDPPLSLLRASSESDFSALQPLVCTYIYLPYVCKYTYIVCSILP